MRERAIAEYHELLAHDESLTPELFARLKGGMSAAHMLYGQRELGISLRPHFLTRQQYELLADRSQVLVGAFDKVAAAILADPELMDRVGVRERERRLALVSPGYAPPAINTRLDAFVYGDQVKFVEYNAENPSSLTDQAGLNQVLFEVRALQLIAERYRMRQFTPVASLLEALLSTYREWGGGGAPNIAILDWADLPTAHEFILLRNYFVGSGIPTIICTPDELEYGNGQLRRGDFRIDLVYKRVIIHEFLDRYDDAHPLIQAYKKHDACLINPFRCKLLHKKASFELLTDESLQHWFTGRELDVIHHCVPWTRLLREGKTIYHGGEIDLVKYIRRHRNNFILKPNDDYGGHGIFFGDRGSESEWEAAIANALNRDYVVQEKLELQTEEFPIFNEREWGLQSMFVDTNPFIFRGVVDGAMVRLSDSPIVNVTSGGGETGFFVLEGD
jgi:Glutathionylspermidine synthase preATP-grasp